MNITEIAAYVVAFMVKHQIRVQRYDAITSKSIYLKFDFGVLYTLRISDHPGKKNLSYRYNISINHPRNKGKYSTNHFKGSGTNIMYHYPVAYIDTLCRDILADRDQKVSKFGHMNYLEYRLQARKKNENNGGFWKESRLLDRNGN